MTDPEFMAIITAQAKKDQAAGYPEGDPRREELVPIVPLFHKADGSLRRDEILEQPCFFGKFSAEQVKEMLA